MNKEKVKKISLSTVKLFLESNMLVYSGNATLFIITAAFPFIALIISIVNVLPWYSPTDVIEFFFRILPDLEPFRDFISGMVMNLKSSSGGVLIGVAALTTLWSASSGVNAIRVGLNQLDGGEKGKVQHNIIKRLVFTLMLIILIPALLIFSMLGDSVQNIIGGIFERMGAEGLLHLKEILDSVFQAGTLIVAVAGFFAALLLYAKLPVKTHTLKSRIPGTVFTGLVSYLFTKLFSFFIPKFSGSSSLYGSLASLFLILLWIRIVMMILFAGGALNKAMEENGIEVNLPRRKA
ncbi:MAG: YihY/virulence factor BrkB family protein [Firmicutes bacterium]|nr:YihY/virulence factor BrkB family protein [Bacillota bacterium]